MSNHDTWVLTGERSVSGPGSDHSSEASHTAAPRAHVSLGSMDEGYDDAEDEQSMTQPGDEAHTMNERMQEESHTAKVEDPAPAANTDATPSTANLASDDTPKPVLLKISFKSSDAKHNNDISNNKLEDDATFAARSWETTNFTIPFLLALRTCFAEKFTDVPDLGPQDIEEGILADPPSADVQVFMCRLLTLAANRSKTVDYPQYNRPLAEVVDRLSPTRGDPAWHGQNPMPQGKKFVELEWQDRLRLLHCIGEWALQESKYCRDLIETHYARKNRPNPLAFDAVGTDDWKHSYFLFKGVDTPFRLFIQTDPARTPCRWYAIASSMEELKVLVDDLRATACFTQRGKQLLQQLDRVIYPECERSCAVRAKLLHNKERALRERYRKQAVAQRLQAQHGDRESMSRTRGKPRVDYNSMLEGSAGHQEDEEVEDDGEEPQRSFSGRLLKRKREELPIEVAGTPSKQSTERSFGPGEVVDGGYLGGYDFDVRSPEEIAAEEAARERLKLNLPFKRWSEVLTKQQQKRKKKQEERERLGLLKPKAPRAKSSPRTSLVPVEPAAPPIPEGPPSQHVLVIGSTGVDLSHAALSATVLQAAAQHCQNATGLDIWLHLPPAIVANPRGFFGRLQGMLVQLYLAAGQALAMHAIDSQTCPVTVIIAGWAGYDLATEHIEWLYACCREEDRGHMARFATKSRHKLQYVQLLVDPAQPAQSSTIAPQTPGQNLQALAKSTPGGSYMGPLPPQMSSFAGVAVQGTFDHLHPGHKILLTCAAILSTQTVYLGLLDDAPAQQRAAPHGQLVQPLAERIHHVARFLSRVRRRVSVHVSPLPEQDVLGPVGSELAVQALVVSKETEALCGTVAGWRIAQSLPLLSNYVTDVVGEAEVCVQAGAAAEQVDWVRVREKKVSSSKIRERWAKQGRTLQEAAKQQAESQGGYGAGEVAVQHASVVTKVETSAFVPSFQRISQDVLMSDA